MSTSFRYGVGAGCLALLCVGACVEATPAKAPPPHPFVTVGSSALALPPIEQYRLAAQVSDAPATRALIAGARFELGRGEVVQANSVAAEQLENGRPMPAFAGGGFVFWNEHGLFRSDTFLGPLKALARLPLAATDVAFGPGFWLVRASDGERLALDPSSGAELPLAPTGLIDIAASADGRVAAVLEWGRAALSSDGGKHYRDVETELGEPVMRLWRNPPGFVLKSNVVARVEGDGRLSRQPLPLRSESSGELSDGRVDDRLARASSLPSKAKVKAKTKGEAPLNEAIARGLLLAPGRALVTFGASVAEVDLRSGALLRQGPQLLPSASNCDLIRLGNDVLMSCTVNETVSIFGHADSEHPALERGFQDAPLVQSGVGELLVEAGCDGHRAPFTVCVRLPGGEWRNLTQRKQLGDPVASPSADAGSASSAGGGAVNAPTPPRSPPSLLGYAPRAAGGAIAFVDAPLNGYVDLTSGRAVALENFLDLKQNLQHCAVDGSGLLRCLARTGPLVFDREGKQQLTPFRFRSLLPAGLRALAWDTEGHCFQTEDLGRTWLEVQGPATVSRSLKREDSCSEVGCFVGGWLRTGWDAVAPKPAEPTEVVALPSLDAERPAQLTCRALDQAQIGVPEARAIVGTYGASDSNGPLPPVWGFGLQQLPGEYLQGIIGAPASGQGTEGSSGSSRGVISIYQKEALDPQTGSTYMQSGPLGFRFVDFFDPAGRAHQASTSLAELVRAAHRSGASEPVAESFANNDLRVTPVLAAEPGKTVGFAGTDNTRVWVNGARAASLMPTPDGWILLSAALDRDGSLVLLFHDGQGNSRVWRDRQGARFELFAAPSSPVRLERATPDAVGISERGELAVVRFPSGARPPSVGDPAQAYVPGKPIQTLAPWSSARLAHDPACASAAAAQASYRMIVAPPRTWFSINRSAEEITDTWGMLAMVRWSSERVCVEALETSGEIFAHAEDQLETRIVLNQFPKPTAARLGFVGGFEFREPLACELALPSPRTTGTSPRP